MDFPLKPYRFLIIDDFGSYRTSLVTMLTEAEVSTTQIDTAANGDDALNLLRENKYDIILCDFYMGEGKDGQQVLEESRSLGILGYATVFIMITAETARAMVLSVVENRPDDYLTKPFNILELSARVKAILRRNSRARVGESVRFGGVIIHFLKREVVRDGETVEFTPKEFELLSFLVHRPGEAVSREVLIEEIWGQSAEVSTRTIDNFVLRIRKKLEIDSTDPKYFQTVYGFGYKYTPDEK